MLHKSSSTSIWLTSYNFDCYMASYVLLITAAEVRQARVLFRYLFGVGNFPPNFGNPPKTFGQVYSSKKASNYSDQMCCSHSDVGLIYRVGQKNCTRFSLQ